MELIVDNNLPNFKHFCKICKKGFLCGSALGGHMRAHGISDEHDVECLDEEDTIDWEDTSRNNKRMNALRSNPNRHRFNRICEYCGDEFSSWNSFLEHGKCNLDDVNSFVTCSKSNEDKEDTRPYGLSKRKMSFDTNISSCSTKLNGCLSSEEEDVANCLMMLSNIEHLKESCTSTKEDERQNPISIIAPTITKTCTPNIDHKVEGVNVVSTNTKSMYECKACKRVFSSHQALGGHRASHKKVKGCFAARLDHVIDQDNIEPDEDHIRADNLEFMIRPSKSMRASTTLQLDKGKPNPSLTMSKKKNKVHECSICHRVFSSGQALGGHKRCHWITSNDPSIFPRFRELGHQMELVNQSSHALDLNDTPSQHEEMMKTSQSPKSLSSFELSTDILLQSWSNCDQENKNYILQSNNNKVQNDEDANSKINSTNLCEIKKHMNSNGCSTPWLQVGIGSNTLVIDHNP